MPFQKGNKEAAKNKGLPKGTANVVSKAKAREQVLNKINKHKDKILLAQIEAAKGMYYLEADGKVVYHKKPDTGMGEYLLNQLIGRPKENVEHTGEVSLKVDL